MIGAAGSLRVNQAGTREFSLPAAILNLTALLFIFAIIAACETKGGRILGMRSSTGDVQPGLGSESLSPAEVTGTILDLENSAVLAGATVRVSLLDDPGGSAETTTDGYGIFSVRLDRAGPAAVFVEREGYAPQSQILSLQGGPNSVQLKIQPVTFVQELNVTAGLKSVEVKVPDNSLSVEISNPSESLGVTGGLRAEITVGDPRENRDAFPGGFVALNTGIRGGIRGGAKRALRRTADGEAETVELASVMLGNITLRDSEGNVISTLKQPAKVRMKIPTGTINPGTNAPFKIGDTIPTYYVDETLGTWVPELDEAGNHVLGTVVQGEDGFYSEFMARHFSWWNLDQPIETRSCVRGRAIDPCGQPQAGVRVCGNGVSFNGATCNGVAGWTDKNEDPVGDDGKFCLDALKGSTISLQTGKGGTWGWFSYSFDTTFTTQEVTMPGTVGTCTESSSACLDLGDIQILATLRKVTGKVVEGDGQVVAGAVVTLDGKPTKTDTEGSFGFSVGPGEGLTLRVAHPKGVSLGTVERIVDVPGVSPTPGQCDALPDVDLGTIEFDTVDLGCARGKVRDENGKPVQGATVVVGGILVTTDQGGNYCLDSLPGDHELKLTYYDKGRGRGHNKKSAVQLVGGGSCEASDEKCVHADIDLELGDACVSGQVADQNGNGLAGAIVRVGSSMVSTGADGAYCLVVPAHQKVKVRFKHLAPGVGTGGSETVEEFEADTESPGQCGVSCVVVNRTLTVDQPPAIAKIESSKPLAGPGEDVVVSVEASDPEGGVLKYLWTASDGELSKVQPGGSKKAPSSLQGVDPFVAWKAPSAPGTYQVSVIAEDTKKGSAMASIEIVVGVDADLDGFTAEKDCDDADPASHPAAVEICDGKDNNCNGEIDEGVGGSSCASAQPGVCSAGKSVCSGGQLLCESLNKPSGETCDGLDNDCDGEVDEATGGGACVTGLPGICSGGVQNCAAGALTCAASLAPTSEICGDGLDNDCDGKIDNGCVCASGQIQSCYAGPSATISVGLCKSGVQTCDSNAWGACVGQIIPGAELCDGKDNDCDGQVDEETGGGSCQTDQPGVCQAGAQQCQAGSLVCVSSNAPSADICDGLDNDCDGTMDEDFAASGFTPEGPLGQSCSAGIGACASGGTYACSPNGQATQCSAVAGNPSTEICDGLDNDCDGSTDEDGVCAPAPPSSLTATAVSSSQINLAWIDASADEDGFTLERKVGAGEFSVLTNAGANATSYQDGSLTASTAYTYRVQAFKGGDRSAFSNEAGATTFSGGGPVSVVWDLEPPASTTSGQPFGVDWTVMGGTSVSHSDVHASISPYPGSYPEFSTPAQTGAPGSYTSSFQVDIPATCNHRVYYFHPHATVDSYSYFGPGVSRLVSSSNPANIYSTPGSIAVHVMAGDPSINTAAKLTTACSSSGESLAWTAAASPQAWLGYSPTSGNSPSEISFSINTTLLAAGVNAGNMTVTMPGAGNSPFDLAVQATLHASAFFNDPVQAASGWTPTGFWHVVTDGVSPFPNSYSPVGSWWYGQDGTGDFDNGLTNSGSLTSGAIALPTSPTLSFWSWEEAEAGNLYDKRTVSISTDGGATWTVVHSLVDAPAVWRQVNVDLSSHQGQSVRIRFEFDTVDEILNSFRGWYVDDIRIFGP